MLRSIVICPNQEMSNQLEAAVLATGGVSIERTLNRYPNAVDMSRTLRAQAPDIIFLSFEIVDEAQAVIKFVESEVSGIQIVAITAVCDAKLLRETMRAGIRELLSMPFETVQLKESLGNVKELIDRKPPTIETSSEIFAFLPSKAGAGTSTIALNVASALARRPKTRVLLSDFDLNSGMMRFMLKLQNEFSVIDAVENSLKIDEHLWPQLVTTLGALDVLHAGRVNPNLRIESAQIRSLMDFARRNYQALCFDLSGNLERYSLEIMQDCKRVLLVCTPEIPSLHLAREKLHFLRSLDLHGRVSVVLNRWSKKAVLSKEQVEEILGVAVARTFQNDYVGVNRALTAGTCIDPTSEMGKAYAQFANELVDPRVPSGEDPKRKFLEFFAVPDAQSLVTTKK